MRTILSLCLFTAFLTASQATDIRVSPTISEVSVYRSGAKISSTASVKIAGGTSEVVFENLSPYFNPNSLQVKIKGGATLISATFQLKTPGPAPENPRAPVLRDSIVLVGDEFTRIRDEREVLTQEQSVIERKLDQVGSVKDGQENTRTLSVNELRELTTFYRQRLLEIKDRFLQLSVKERKFNELYRLLQEALQKIQPNTGNSTGEIRLKLETTAAQSVDITCTYLVTEAGWSPLYDIRSEGQDKPLRLIYKASVYNRTGFDWKGVKMLLSTANPLANNDRPVMTPVFLDFRTVYTYQETESAKKDINVYNLAQAPATSAPRDMERAAGGELDDRLAQPEAPEENNEDLITNFELAKPQDIPANGEGNVVTVDEQDMPAEYEYHSVPKLEPAVFLLAKITDYGRFNLLPGIANIFYQDTYIGQTSLNPYTVSDTLLLSLGRDEQITVKRVQPKDFTERRKVFSNTIKETYTYEIAVKNNKSVPVSVEVLDQIPVSRQKDIVVELSDHEGAVYNEEFGKLKWELQIPAGQSKRVRFTYSVKYPKEKAVGMFKS